jgi:hypothetical protein
MDQSPTNGAASAGPAGTPPDADGELDATGPEVAGPDCSDADEACTRKPGDWPNRAMARTTRPAGEHLNMNNLQGK